jgi:hypothetical protein
MTVSSLPTSTTGWEEKIHDEAFYYTRLLAVDIREEEVEGNVMVQIEDLSGLKDSIVTEVAEEDQ